MIANAAFQQRLFANQEKFEKSLRKHYNRKSLQVTNPQALEDALNAYTANIYTEYFKSF